MTLTKHSQSEFESLFNEAYAVCLDGIYYSIHHDYEDFDGNRCFAFVPNVEGEIALAFPYDVIKRGVVSNELGEFRFISKDDTFKDDVFKESNYMGEWFDILQKVSFIKK